MRTSVLVFSLGLMVSLAVAQDSTSQPIDLQADSGYFDQQAGRAVYEGNVKVTQGVATIWAHKITIMMNNNTAERIEADSNKSKPVRFEYNGEKHPIKGQGQKAVYRVANKTVTLSGNAKVEQGKDVITGSKLTYDLSKEVIKGSRVRMTFQPGKKQ